MTKTTSESIVRDLLATAGIKINGTDPWDIKVNDPRLYDRIFREPNLALGEGYIDGWWDCEAIDQFMSRSNCQVERKSGGELANWFVYPQIQAAKHAIICKGV